MQPVLVKTELIRKLQVSRTFLLSIERLKVCEQYCCFILIMGTAIFGFSFSQATSYSRFNNIEEQLLEDERISSVFGQKYTISPFHILQQIQASTVTNLLQ